MARAGLFVQRFLCCCHCVKQRPALCGRVDAILSRNYYQRRTAHLCCPLGRVIIQRFANGQKGDFDIHLREAGAVLLKECF